MVKSLSVGIRPRGVYNRDKTSLEANEPLALVLRGSPFRSTIYTASGTNIPIDGTVRRESGVEGNASCCCHGKVRWLGWCNVVVWVIEPCEEGL